MNSVGSRNGDKKTKSFDFKWFQRSSKPPPLSRHSVSGPCTNTAAGSEPIPSRGRANSRATLTAERSRSGSVPELNTVPFPTRQPRVSTSLKSSSRSSRDSSDLPATAHPAKEHSSHARVLLHETQNFLNRYRRGTEESRSRSSSLVQSLRRPSEFSDHEITEIFGSRPNSYRERSLSATASVGSSHSDKQPPVWQRRTLPLQPPPTIGVGNVLDDKDVQALHLDPMAVRYADHMHYMGYAHNRYVLAMLAEDSSPRVDRRFNAMVMIAFVMRMLRFHGEPLDMSLRKFLFRVALPQEAQQIERVLQCFSILWDYHNPHIFADNDQVLTVTFSLLMLHTDQFNRNVKRKMGKADFVRTAAVDGVAPEIFEYFYDNITALPFRADEDPPTHGAALSPLPGVSPSALSSLLGSAEPPASGPASASTSALASASTSAPASASTSAPTSTSASAHRPAGESTLPLENASPVAIANLDLSPHSEYADETITQTPPPVDVTFCLSPPSPVAASAAVQATPPFENPFVLGTPSTVDDSLSLNSKRSPSFTWMKDHQPDPYPYLLENRLDVLRPELSGVPKVPEIDAADFTSIEEFQDLQWRLKQTQALQIVLPKSRPLKDRSASSTERPPLDRLQSGFMSQQPPIQPGRVAVEVLRYGTLLRREMRRTLGGSRPAWREWGVFLTNSRLYLFKHTSVVQQMDDEEESETSIDTLQAATVIPVTNIAAVVSQNSKTAHEFTIIEGSSLSPHCFAVDTDEELKHWVQMVNVVATQATLQVQVELLSPVDQIQAALDDLDDQTQVVQARIDSLVATLQHFELLAPITQRTRESLVFKAGAYSSRCEDAFIKRARLKVYESVLRNACNANTQYMQRLRANTT